MSRKGGHHLTNDAQSYREIPRIPRAGNYPVHWQNLWKNIRCFRVLVSCAIRRNVMWYVLLHPLTKYRWVSFNSCTSTWANLQSEVCFERVFRQQSHTLLPLTHNFAAPLRSLEDSLDQPKIGKILGKFQNTFIQNAGACVCRLENIRKPFRSVSPTYK